MPARYRYFDPAAAARFGKLGILARSAVEGMVTGLHKSPHHGFSVEFSEHREYVPGDEIRQLDWRTYARTDRYYIKLCEQETNLRCHILIDRSASMAYAGPGTAGPASTGGAAAGRAPSKYDFAARIAALLAYLLTRQADSVGLTLFDEENQTRLPPGSAPHHLDRLFRMLEESQPAKGTSMAGVLHRLADTIARRSLVVLISDLYDDVPTVIRALRHFRARRHQVILLQPMHPAELDLPFARITTLVDLETGERVQVDPATIREAYKAEVQGFLDSYRRACSDAGIEYAMLPSDQPPEQALRSFLARRQ